MAPAHIIKAEMRCNSMTKRRIRVISAALAGLMCFCAVFAMAPAASADGEIGKITVRTVKNYDPYVLDSVLDHSATESSTGGAYTSQATWYDSDGNTVSGLFEEGTYTVEITVYAVDGYSFAPDAPGYINNDPAEVTYVDSGTVILRRQVGVYTWNYTQIWKNPGDEKLESGGTASFVVSGVYFTDVSWTLVDTDGNNVSLTKAGEMFPDVSFQPSRPDENTARMNIRSVPGEMNGWKIYATLSNPTSSANTGKAKIVITDAAPTPTPTPAPTEKPDGDTSDQDGTQTPSPAGTDGEEEHEHFFSPAWRNNENGHWHECACGEKSDLAAHSMSWTTVDKATGKAPGREHGVCSVCGYTEDKEIPYEGGSGALGKLFIVLIAVIAVVILVLVIEQARYNGRVRKRKAYKKKYR